MLSTLLQIASILDGISDAPGVTHSGTWALCSATAITLPPLPEQRAIAHILGTLDDKIELNRRMSATLEAMARALFKSWFVDFEPVRAKVEGRDPGLPPHLAALFPDRSSRRSRANAGRVGKYVASLTTLLNSISAEYRRS